MFNFLDWIECNSKMKNFCRRSILRSRCRKGYGPGGYFWEFVVGVCRPVLQILTLFQTKQSNHFPLSTLPKQLSPRATILAWRQSWRRLSNIRDLTIRRRQQRRRKGTGSSQSVAVCVPLLTSNRRMSSKFDPRWRVMKNQPQILCQSEIKDEIFRMKNRCIPIFYS